MLGSHVVYRAHKDHHNKTIVGHKKDDAGNELKDDEGNKIPIEVEGSIHHRELRIFAGLVTRVNRAAKKGEKDTYDIVIFPPGAAPNHVEGVREGGGDHEIEFTKT